ncbi:MAG: tetratricopeptide repeat protein [Sedimentisphaerales bacterium]|nr:tetratricopeptide repeat protein [Sedimentisphaerales bacterium]
MKIMKYGSIKVKWLEVIACLSAVAIVFICCGCGVEAVRLTQQAQIYCKYGEYDKARELLEKSIEADYENPASHYWMARCYDSLGDRAKALWEYELAVRFDPAMELAQMAYIKALYNNNQVAKSVDATVLFLKHKDAAARDFMRLAENFLEAGMEKHALHCYHAGARAEPNNAVPFLAVADYFFGKPDKDKGVEYLVKAFKVDPCYPGLARRLGEHNMRVSVPEPPLFPSRSKIEEELYELEL